MFVHMAVCLGLIGLVLLQHGRGADAGAAFGSGASQTLFGARGSSSFLTRATALLAALFFASSLTLAYLSGQSHQRQSVTDLVSPATTKAVTKAPNPPNGDSTDLPPTPEAQPTPVPVIPGSATPAQDAKPSSRVLPSEPSTADQSPVVTTVPQAAPIASVESHAPPAKEAKSDVGAESGNTDSLENAVSDSGKETGVSSAPSIENTNSPDLPAVTEPPPLTGASSSVSPSPSEGSDAAVQEGANRPGPSQESQGNQGAESN